MTGLVGLTWDHPRGREALQAASLPGLTWEVHSLEGFESSPIDELAERYDLIVLDHPHLGDALATNSLRPLNELFGADELRRWAAGSVGPSASSYVLDGQTWALPLDAATQVSARRADLLAEAPRTWTEALELDVAVAPSLAGPHAFLTFCSIAVSLGGELGDEFFAATVTDEALAILFELAKKAPDATADRNPIALLELMTTTDELAYVPLVYGYVTYSPRVTFGAPPAAAATAAGDGLRVGSTIGGTGIAVTRRSTPTSELLDHLRWLMSPETQSGFIPDHAGQPSARSAWTDATVDAAAGGFYSGTLDTIERSWVRPRFAGYIPFQTEASAIIRAGLTGAPSTTATRLDNAYRKARP